MGSGWAGGDGWQGVWELGPAGGRGVGNGGSVAKLSVLLLRIRSALLLHSRSALLLRSRSALLLRSRNALLLRSRSALLLRSRSALLVASGLCSKCESPLKQLTPTPLALLKIRIEFNIQGEYHCWFQKLVQECNPGSLPGARSWGVSRNMKSYLKLQEMARNKFWDFFVRGAVWNNRHFTPPLWDGVK